MNVTLLPHNLRLDLEAGANLLDALLAREVPVSYSCMAGQCATCRCTVVAGTVRTQSGDAVREAGAGESVLACRSVVSSDCTIELPEVDEIVTHPAKLLKGTVIALDDLTHDVKRLRLALNKPLAFSPGQYASLQFTPQHVRSYSMANIGPADELEFHVRIVPGGHVTSYVASQLRIGDTVRVSGPRGTAYLRRTHTGPMLCIAGGTGLAPILSIVRGTLEAGMRNPLHVYVGMRAANDVYGLDTLEALRAQHPDLHVHVVVATGTAHAGWRCGPATDAVAHDWPDLGGWRAYVAGSPAMTDAASALLQAKGIEPARIYADAFHTQSA
ncbi:Naphthalene 1,2-dioxygenase/salicylate 5-hydroxylase systems, ferredoxin--NAD(P)(+), reductase component [Paraburkholderia caffeinitolerans]|uniref:Naphthalene 1,2-dioxygenase/salicylate 5-hydroxylase systems, ferredoxin--NAD(P)(+), reductase component n=1 Tax=Paraburkholderia caffeinitolerans TaxID=1723730 RepID=A0A6J5FYW0_9BURK|nr:MULTISPECIES: FAD-binding oxidoreductase [Paraburkholderia]CAB3788544.1 Naphthalene 1,2-dioxygenase/salicylate 5-hydroxylase systems, ferredoxin--NAD(P)(+), reductase component [Paraburkholderia caffeinitolerans]